MADFRVDYEPQDKQKLYHAIGSTRFARFMPYLYNGFPMSDKIEAEKPYEERKERYDRGELTILEEFIIEVDNIIHEAVYGGSRGGGKSYSDAGEAALLAQIFPGLKIGIFRKTYTSLNESITEKLVAMLPRELKDNKKTGWSYVRKDNVIKYHFNDTVIKLCYCENYQDALKYRGWEFDIIIIDEECDLDDRTVNFLKGTIRTAKHIKFEDGSPCRFPVGHAKRYIIDKKGRVTKKLAYVNYPSFYRASVNPEGPGFIRVRDKFVRPTEYGKKVLEEEKTLRNGVKVIRRKAFIQAKMEDNLYLNDDYELQFEDMSPEERAKNVEGDWDVSDTNFFRKFNRGAHIIDSILDILPEEEKIYIQDGQEFPSHYKCFGALDWGFYPDYAALTVWYTGDNNVVHRFEFIWNNLAINEASLHILELQKEYTFKMEAVAIPHDMAMQGETYFNSKGEVLGFTKEKVMNHYGIMTIVTRSSREDGWDKLHELQATKNDDDTYLYSIYRTCYKTIAQYETLSRDEVKQNDIRNGQEDHLAESARYFAVMYSRFLNQFRKVSITKSYRQKMFEKSIAKNIETRKIDFQNYLK